MLPILQLATPKDTILYQKLQKIKYSFLHQEQNQSKGYRWEGEYCYVGGDPSYWQWRILRWHFEDTDKLRIIDINNKVDSFLYIEIAPWKKYALAFEPLINLVVI